MAVGAALASNHPYYGGGYYGRPYYGGGYYAPAYAYPAYGYYGPAYDYGWRHRHWCAYHPYRC